MKAATKDVTMTIPHLVQRFTKETHDTFTLELVASAGNAEFSFKAGQFNKRVRDAAYETVRWTSTLSFPDFEQDYEFVALSHPQEYAIIEGNLISNKGLNMAISEYEVPEKPAIRWV